jgi:hypothetical protein
LDFYITPVGDLFARERTDVQEGRGKREEGRGKKEEGRGMKKAIALDRLMELRRLIREGLIVEFE